LVFLLIKTCFRADGGFTIEDSVSITAIPTREVVYGQATEPALQSTKADHVGSSIAAAPFGDFQHEQILAAAIATGRTLEASTTVMKTPFVAAAGALLPFTINSASLVAEATITATARADLTSAEAPKDVGTLTASAVAKTPFVAPATGLKC
jgi:hypothetical protein